MKCKAQLQKTLKRITEESKTKTIIMMATMETRPFNPLKPHLMSATAHLTPISV